MREYRYPRNVTFVHPDKGKLERAATERGMSVSELVRRVLNGEKLPDIQSQKRRSGRVGAAITTETFDRLRGQADLLDTSISDVARLLVDRVLPRVDPTA